MATNLGTYEPGLPETDQKRNLIALVLATVILLSLLLADFHHHPDGHDHPDCSICAVGQHKSAITTAAQPVALVLPTSFYTPFTTPPLFSPTPWNPGSPQNRAPPV